MWNCAGRTVWKWNVSWRESRRRCTMKHSAGHSQLLLLLMMMMTMTGMFRDCEETGTAARVPSTTTTKRCSCRPTLSGRRARRRRPAGPTRTRGVLQASRRRRPPPPRPSRARGAAAAGPSVGRRTSWSSCRTYGVRRTPTTSAARRHRRALIAARSTDAGKCTRSVRISSRTCALIQVGVYTDSTR